MNSDVIRNVNGYSKFQLLMNLRTRKKKLIEEVAEFIYSLSNKH